MHQPVLRAVASVVLWFVACVSLPALESLLANDALRRAQGNVREGAGSITAVTMTGGPFTAPTVIQRLVTRHPTSDDSWVSLFTPISTAVEIGDLYRCELLVRCTSGAPGKITIDLQQSEAPYQCAWYHGETAIGSEWRWVQFAATATIATPPMTAQLVIVTRGIGPQTIEIGKLKLVRVKRGPGG